MWAHIHHTCGGEDGLGQPWGFGAACGTRGVRRLCWRGLATEPLGLACSEGRSSRGWRAGRGEESVWSGCSLAGGGMSPRAWTAAGSGVVDAAGYR